MVGDGNTVTYGEVFDYDRFERIMQTQFKNVEKLVDQKIANAQDVKVVNKQPLLVRNPAGLDLLARKAREALLKRDYTNAEQRKLAGYSGAYERSLDARWFGRLGASSPTRLID